MPHHQGRGLPISLIRHALGAVVFSTFSIVGITIALLLLPWRGARIRLGNVLGAMASQLILWIAGIRLDGDWSSLSQRAPALYVTNHSSNADPWISMILCPVGGCGVAKKEILLIPFFGQAYWIAGHLLLDRADSTSAVAAMKGLADLVHTHRLSVWLWPEGTQSRDGRLLPFKRGFVHLAIATGLPVIPVVMHDAHLCWPARSLTIIPGTIRIEVLDTIDTSQWRAETAEAHASEVRERFARSVAVHQRPVPV